MKIPTHYPPILNLTRACDMDRTILIEDNASNMPSEQTRV